VWIARHLGSDELWDLAEGGLRDGLRDAGISFEEQPGEGAFYGPKVDLHVADSLGRSWQMGSVQLDYQLPERFDLRYIDSGGRDCNPEGRPNRPVISHRAMFGSLERFIAILLEHADGWLPLWLSPEAVRVLPVGEADETYACAFVKQLRQAGVRGAVAPRAACRPGSGRSGGTSSGRGCGGCMRAFRTQCLAAPRRRLPCPVAAPCRPGPARGGVVTGPLMA
jgi:threonyl-tRNA synthetase